MKKTLIIVTGIPRSGTSMMMRTLELGGIPCVYKDSHPDEMKKKYKNIYGFYEGGTIPEEGGVAVKRFGKVAVENLSKKFDCYFIFMYRPADAVLGSWKAVGNSKGGDYSVLLANQKKVYSEVKKHKNVFISYDKINQDTENELLKLKDFLPLDFDVGKALKAIDKTLYINRNNMETTLNEEGFVEQTTKTPLEEYVEQKKREIDLLDTQIVEFNKQKQIVLDELAKLSS